MAFSTYLGNKILDHILGNGEYSPPTVYVSLHDGDPGLDGANELSGSGYARVAHAVWDAANAKASENTGVITMTTPSGSWGTVTHCGLWDALSGGNFLIGGALVAEQVVQTGAAISFADGAIDFAVS